MQGVHELADLAPRDVVAKAITRRMIETGHPHMWLDARHLGAAFWERRFPTILATARSHGVDPVTELIPVAPACHYASGGVRTDLWGRSDVPGPLRHRRGRLLRRARRQPAGLQLPARGAGLLPPDRRRCCPASCAPLGRPGRRRPHRAGWCPATVRRELQEVMTDAGRRAAQRRRAGRGRARRSTELAGAAADAGRPASRWETTNLLTISTALADAAAAARGDPRLPLARGLPRARRRALGRPLRRRLDRRRRHHAAFRPAAADRPRTGSTA